MNTPERESTPNYIEEKSFQQQRELINIIALSLSEDLIQGVHDLIEQSVFDSNISLLDDLNENERELLTIELSLIVGKSFRD
tara:strand:+ start:219 stop:464 length:246 start_codon:yes stop_codon:yes gene_type:complete